MLPGAVRSAASDVRARVQRQLEERAQLEAQPAARASDPQASASQSGSSSLAGHARGADAELQVAAPSHVSLRHGHGHHVSSHVTLTPATPSLPSHGGAHWQAHWQAAPARQPQASRSSSSSKRRLPVHRDVTGTPRAGPPSAPGLAMPSVTSSWVTVTAGPAAALPVPVAGASEPSGYARCVLLPASGSARAQAERVTGASQLEGYPSHQRAQQPAASTEEEARAASGMPVALRRSASPGPPGQVQVEPEQAHSGGQEQLEEHGGESRRTLARDRVLLLEAEAVNQL